MASYTSIEFNIDIARNIIIQECDKVMKEAIDKHLGTLKYVGKVIGEYYNGTNAKDYDIEFEDIRAWVMFFGMGQGIDQSNPYLDEYKQSSFWEETRLDDGTIVKRGYDQSFDQYSYKTGKLKHYEHGADERGDPLVGWQQKAFNVTPDVDFWQTIQNIYNSFLEGFNNTALSEITRRFNQGECFTIETHKA